VVIEVKVVDRAATLDNVEKGQLTWDVGVKSGHSGEQ